MGKSEILKYFLHRCPPLVSPCIACRKTVSFPYINIIFIDLYLIETSQKPFSLCWQALKKFYSVRLIDSIKGTSYHHYQSLSWYSPIFTYSIQAKVNEAILSLGRCNTGVSAVNKPLSGSLLVYRLVQ